MVREKTERVFAEHRARVGSGSGESFDELCAAHPEIADELRELHADFQACEDALREALPEPDGLFSFLHSRPGGARGEAVRSHAAPLDAGVHVGGYRLVRLLGRGGMGQVWEADELALERRVALKLIRADRQGERAVDLFKREARAGGRVRHRAIVSVYAAGEVGGVHFIAQELVEGGFTLADALAEMRERDELPPQYYERIAELFVEVADALGAAHDEGVIHRDIKPHNILITPDDTPKVTDFGLARLIDEATVMPSGPVGTYAYMSPEQADPRIGVVDRRSDVFSLGAVLYEALTLRRAFDGDTERQILDHILFDDPPDPRTVRSQVPGDLALICMKALQKRRRDRWSSMRAFADDLRAYLADEPIAARPPSAWIRFQKWKRRHPTASATIGLGLVFLLVVSYLLLRVVDTANEALRHTYVAHIRAVPAHVRDGNLAEARRALETCPEAMRDWEWDHLAWELEPRLGQVRFAMGGLACFAGLAESPADVVGGAPAGPGALCVAGTADGRLCAFDADGALARAPIAAHAATVTMVARDASGARVLSGARDGGLRLDRLDDPTRVRWLARPGGGDAPTVAPVAGALSDDGSFALVVADDGTAVGYAIADGRESVAVPVPLDGIRVAARLHGATFGVGTDDGRVVVLERSGEGAELRVVRATSAHEASVAAVAASRGGARVVSGAADGSLAIVDARDGSLLARASLSAAVTSLATRLDGEWVAAATADGTLHVRDAHDLEPISIHGPTTAPPVGLTWLAGPDTLLVLGADGVADAWAARTSMTIAAHEGPVRALAFDVEGARLFSAGDDALVRVWSAGAGAPLGVLVGHAAAVTALSAAAGQLASGDADAVVALWDLESDAPRATLAASGPVTDLALAPDGQWVAAVTSTARLHVWDAETGEVQLVRDGIGPSLARLEDDSRRLLVPHDGWLAAIDARTDATWPIVATDVACSAIAVARDTLAFAGTDRVVRTRLDDRAGPRLAGHVSTLVGLAVTPRGSRVVSAAHGSMRVWDLDGDELLTLRAGGDAFTALALGPHGRRLAVGRASGTIGLWSPDAGDKRAFEDVEARRRRLASWLEEAVAACLEAGESELTAVVERVVATLDPGDRVQAGHELRCRLASRTARGR